MWLYGGLSLTMLAIAGFFYDQKLTVIFSIMAMGFAYAAEFVAQEEEWGRHWAPTHFQISLVIASVICGLFSYSTLILNQ